MAAARALARYFETRVQSVTGGTAEYVREHRGWLIATGVLAAVLYVVVWIGWSTPWSWVVSADDTALRATYDYAVTRPAWIVTWDVICTVFSPIAFRVLALGVIVWAAMRRQWRLVGYLAVAVELPGLLTEFAKGLADRPRPDTALVWASSTSFPSGHALGTAAAVLAILALVLPLIRPRHRPALLALGVVIILAVGIGRVLLNVHHPSDVVAGWALGYLWFVVTLPLLPAAELREEAGTPEARDS